MSNSNDLKKQTNIEISPINPAEKKEQIDTVGEEKTLQDIKIKKSKKNVIQLELGQFIKIVSPGNDNLDEKTFYINYLDENFEGNEKFKKIVQSSAFCSEDNNIINDNYKIIKDQKIGIIPPIGGG